LLPSRCATALLALALVSCGGSGNVSNSDWALAGHGYDNNRYVESDITKTDVQQLSTAWRTPIVDDGEQEAVFDDITRDRPDSFNPSPPTAAKRGNPIWWRPSRD
jgi:hypothetical protein